jgi:hypothetical protein
MVDVERALPHDPHEDVVFPDVELTGAKEPGAGCRHSTPRLDEQAGPAIAHEVSDGLQDPWRYVDAGC